MGVTIDNLQIEIKSSSTNAAQGIDALASSLEKLKKNGSFKTVSNNLNNLSQSLNGLNNVHGASNALRTLANSIEKLKSVGSISSISNSLAKLPNALKSVSNINLDKTRSQLEGVADAVSPLSNIKAGGLGTMVNSLSKIGKVTESLDSETIKKFSARIEELNKALGPLSQKMESIKTGFKAINSNAKTAASGVDDFNDKVDASALNMSSFIEIGRAVIETLQAVIRKFSEFVDQAIQWDGISSRFGRGFGDKAQETYEWIQRLNEEMGINIQQFMQYSSIYANMLTGFGVANEDATTMALGYTELTYDIWAGYNDIYKSFEEASEAVKSAIAGEVEPIRRAGFTIVEATLEQTAANHGLEISIHNATEAEKSYLRYLTLVDQAHAQSLVGTYAKELSTAEGLMRTFSQQTKSLSQAFGSLFLPVLVKVMPYLQAFVELLAEGVRWLAKMFGIEIQEVDWSGYNDGVSDAVSNTENVAGALNDATEAAKELKNASIGIDELNVISPNTATASGGAGGAGGAGGSTGLENIDIDSMWDESIFDNVKSKVSGIVDNMKEWLGLTGEIDTWGEFFETRLGRILLVVGEIGIAIASWKVTKKFLDAIAAMKALLANPYYAVTIGVIVTIAGIIFAAQGMKDAIENGLDGFNFAEIVGGGLLTVAGSALLGNKFATWLGKAFAGKGVGIALEKIAVRLGVSTAGAAGAALASAFTGIIWGIPTYFTGIYDACMNGLDWLNGLLIPAGSTAAGAGIGAIIGSLGGPIGTGIGALIGLVIGLITDGILLIVDHWDDIVDFFADFFTETIPNMWYGFLDWCEGVGNFFTNDVPKFFSDTVKRWGETISYGLGYALGTVARKFVEWWDSVVTFFTEDIPNFFTKTIPRWGTALRDSTVKAFNNVTDAISDWFNDDFVPFFTETIPNFFTETIPKFFTETIPELFTETIPEIGAELKKDFEELGKYIVDGIWSGLKKLGSSIADFFVGLKDTFVKAFKDAFEIHSPSKVFARLGQYLVDGIVSPFTSSVNAIRDKTSAMWNSAKSWWDNKKGTMKSYTPSIGSIYDKLSERWTNARDWWNNKKSSLKTYTPSIGSIYEKVYERWKNARDWWNSKKGSFKSYTPSIGSITDKLKSAWSSAKSWWSKNAANLSTKLNVKVPTISVKWSTAEAFGKSFKYPTGFSLKFAALGGVFDQGSLVWAGERGPEILANAAGGKTGVMNVQQMQDAVYEGVYSAVVAAMRGGSSNNGTQSVNVYLDGKQITATVEKRQRERGASIMGNEVYAY